MGAGTWGDFPQELKKILFSSYLTKPNLPDRVSRGLHLPRRNPQITEEVEAGTGSPDECLAQAEGCVTSFRVCSREQRWAPSYL